MMVTTPKILTGARALQAHLEAEALVPAAAAPAGPRALAALPAPITPAERAPGRVHQGEARAARQARNLSTAEAAMTPEASAEPAERAAEPPTRPLTIRAIRAK